MNGGEGLLIRAQNNVRPQQRDGTMSQTSNLLINNIVNGRYKGTS